MNCKIPETCYHGSLLLWHLKRPTPGTMTSRSDVRRPRKRQKIYAMPDPDFGKKFEQVLDRLFGVSENVPSI